MLDVWLNGYMDDKVPPIIPRVIAAMSAEELEREKNKACFPMMCKTLCVYESEEYDNAKSLGDFTS